MILYGDIVVKIRNKEDHYIVTWSDLQDKLLKEMQDIELAYIDRTYIDRTCIYIYRTCYILCKKMEDKVKKRIKGVETEANICECTLSHSFDFETM